MSRWARPCSAGLESWLAGLSREELLDLLRERLFADRDLRRRLEAKATAARASGSTDLAELRARLVDLGAVAERIEEAHREACQVTGADPVETATWLAGHLLGPAPLPDVDPEDYTGRLGESGRTRYLEPITDAWHRNPSGWTERYLMEERLRSDSDLDGLIALLAADPAPTARHIWPSPGSWTWPGAARRRSNGPSAACVRPRENPTSTNGWWTGSPSGTKGPAAPPTRPP